MEGPETVIALCAVVAMNSGPIALILLWGPSKSHLVGGGQCTCGFMDLQWPPRAHVR